MPDWSGEDEVGRTGGEAPPSSVVVFDPDVTGGTVLVVVFVCGGCLDWD